MNTDVSTAVNQPISPGGSQSQPRVTGEAVSSPSSQQLATGPAFQLTRWELQARILANQPAEDISQQMCLPLAVIRGYEAAHFPVRSRLAHSAFVLREIICAPLDDVWQPTAVARFWSWMGFTYGAAALDEVIPPFLALDDEFRSLGLLASCIRRVVSAISFGRWSRESSYRPRRHFLTPVWRSSPEFGQRYAVGCVPSPSPPDLFWRQCLARNAPLMSPAWILFPA